MSAPAKNPDKGKGPLIPEVYIDPPSQRLYYLSIGLLCQAIKAIDFIAYYSSFGETRRLCWKWLPVDAAYCLVLSQLRIPRLRYSFSVVALQILCLWFIDALLFGGITLNLGAHGRDTVDAQYGELPSTSTSSAFSSWFGFSGASYGGSNDAHLLGQHTVRMSPISTAQLNPGGTNYCLGSATDAALVPILLNNTAPITLRYSLTSLDGSVVDYIDVSSKELKSIEHTRQLALQSAKATASARHADDYDDYDDDDDEQDKKSIEKSSLQNTQSLMHLRLPKPGRIRLERVVDASGIEARLVYPWEVLVTHCPRVQFADIPSMPEVRCAGQDGDHEFTIELSGVPPLSLRWFKQINGRKEDFLVEGIEGDHETKAALPTGADGQLPLTTARSLVHQNVKVPLSVSTTTVGSHLYVLEEVSDAVGNVIRVGTDLASVPTDAHTTTTTRSFNVLPRSSVSFHRCGPGKPTAMRIGGEATLVIGANEADKLDLPLNVTLAYAPRAGESEGKPWVKTLTSGDGYRDITVPVNAPGIYTIESVQGKFCAGDVLSPETCEVVERPMPSAKIDWKKIHECSGDTGVSFTPVMHGAAPFTLHYTTQRDSEPAREYQQTFPTSRGELLVQPEQSGHYVIKFLAISDANYKRVALDGPVIDQIVHSPALADFALPSGARNKRQMSTCDGDAIDVAVDLRGSGPWNVELQIVGPTDAEKKMYYNLQSSPAMISVPIPAKVDRDGGSFEIDLVSVQDKYKCTRPITVPGITVNVRRIKPTVKFYGDKREVTVLERETAELPLRLTGDGPWSVRYRHLDAPNQPISTKRFTNANAYLEVKDKGTYELLKVTDSQCPGTVVPNFDIYRVQWVPRPSAKLSQNTEATFDRYNGSHILPSVCEGVPAHVDLELTGKAPFEIMYNIAQNDGNGGTSILDQPTLTSIQSRTRLQLQTTNPGRVYYEVKQIGDSSYPLAKHRNVILHRSERLLFEQHIKMRPSARFANRNRLAYCQNDDLRPLDNSDDGKIVLEGTPPFTVNLMIKNMAHNTPVLKIVEVNERSWKLNIEDFWFMAPGPHLIMIESVSDAAGCAHAELNPLETMIWVDVAESAAIVPFDSSRKDYCVGEAAQFQLEGIPPWTISYKLNGRNHHQEAKTSPFSLTQQQPGVLSITSIAHQQKKCQAAVSSLHYNIHALPSAKVGAGQRIYQDIHEGDQAEIVFELDGEPPFTFTYQRSESVAKSGRQGKVLETHTAKTMDRTYSVFSALEGTWTVTSISDKWCRYPPAQPDGTLVKQK
ncbi:hypothetical protein CYLTODRAFT_485323 [Cylindrobasidium torrendii FP15055 ss-10]|uniref:Nucleoporin Pom152 n=1 Tax=Cylindrobasidium torrendii FP15055 ss-10 TaxID=1314674 RepID=A0A0D7BTG7_9AGAR|nr:hypothetical protein CYLTODRAFT_485323 [Cylindrobasidium torrendii FP15055 ss-10]